MFYRSYMSCGQCGCTFELDRKDGPVYSAGCRSCRGSAYKTKVQVFSDDVPMQSDPDRNSRLMRTD